ncbi:hypothetical protein T09_525 [Trichinella sp. T9]|nr:hypothetical protein T09_525 [Trichinella sp. T9]
MTSTSCGCITVNTPIFQTLWEEPIKLHRPEILSSSKISF